MNNSVTYKGEVLMKNSEAYSLWERKEYAKLDEHMKALNKKYVPLPEHLRNFAVGAQNA